MRIPIHIISSYFYCPFKAYLEYRRVKGIETKEMIIGRQWHDLIEKEHRKRANIKISLRDAIFISKAEKTNIIFREVPVEEDILYGRIDELIIGPKFFLIIDDKPRYSEGYKLQVLFYAYTFLKNFSDIVDRPIMMAIRRRENKNYMWYDVFRKEHIPLVKKYTKKLIYAINGEFNGATIDERKCNKCSYKNLCPFRFLYRASRDNKAN